MSLRGLTTPCGLESFSLPNFHHLMLINRHLKLTLVAATALGFAMTACQSEDLSVPQNEVYTREFIKKYGKIDPTHDWNTAEQASVTVTTAAPTTVKILADVDGHRYLFGTFIGVNGTQTLNVDVPKGTRQLIVRTSGRDRKVNVGGNVTLASRTMSEPGTAGSMTYSIAPLKEFPFTALDVFINQAVPEEKENTAKEGTITDAGGVEHDYKLVNNFHFENRTGSEQTITFYPLYWNTSSYHALGVYWLDDNGNFSAKNMMDLYYTKSGELEYLPKGAYDQETQVRNDTQCWDKVEAGETCSTHNQTVEEASAENPRFYASYDQWNGLQTQKYEDGSHFHIGYLTVPSGWTSCGTSQAAYSSEGEATPEKVRSRGISITVPNGVKYGFYLKVSEHNSLDPERPKLTDEEKESLTAYTKNGLTYYVKDNQEYYNDGIHHIVFSQAVRNQRYANGGASDIYNCYYQDQVYANGQNPDKVFGTYVQLPSTTEVGVNYTYFAFEDWSQGATDLNDVVFIFDTENAPSDDDTTVDIIDEDEPEEPVVPWQWIIAAEDLGATDDFDFNDVVFGVYDPTTVLETQAENEIAGTDKPVEETPSATKTVKIQALAAGGTLPVYLYYQKGDTKSEDDIISLTNGQTEWHQWFGKGFSSNQMINTGAGPKAEGKEVEIQVNKDFTLSCCKTVNSDKGNMGGFYLSVEGGNSGKHKAYLIEAPKYDPAVAVAPQMLCLPYEWYWPTERIDIQVAYTEFATWVENQSACPEWHKNPTDGTIFKRTIVTGGGTSGGGTTGGGTTGGGTVTPDPTNAYTLSITQEGVVNAGEWDVYATYTLSDEVKQALTTATKATFKIAIADNEKWQYDLGISHNGTKFNGSGNILTDTYEITGDNLTSLKEASTLCVQLWSECMAAAKATIPTVTLTIE